MTKLRAVLGIVAGALLVLSSAAHSILGWNGLSFELTAANAAPDLIRSVKIGWQFGGVVMLTLGIIVLVLFAKRFRGEQVSVVPAVVIGIAYVAFGIWAIVITDFNPFGLIFIIPGVLLIVASRKT